MSEISEVVDSLARKLESLDLTEEEATLLDLTLQAATAPEVEGFAFQPTPDKFGLPDLRGRIETVVKGVGVDVKSLFPSRNVVVNHEEQY